MSWTRHGRDKNGRVSKPTDLADWSATRKGLGDLHPHGVKPGVTTAGMARLVCLCSVLGSEWHWRAAPPAGVPVPLWPRGDRKDAELGFEV